MSDCSKHKDYVEGFSGNLTDLAEKIGDLRYDTLAEFFCLLSDKICRDGYKDKSAGRTKLAVSLFDISEYLESAEVAAIKSWKISEPYMKPKWDIEEKDNFLGEKVNYAKVIAHIKNTITGEIREYPTGIMLNDDNTPYTFYWEEGNASCDCNRELFFGYAIGLKYNEISHECGEEKFRVNLENPVTGDIFYKEFENV